MEIRRRDERDSGEKKDVSEHIISDKWTEVKGVTLSEEWTGTAGFQVLKTSRADRKWLAEWAEESAKLQAAPHQ